jgi:hypothetical protein
MHVDIHRGGGNIVNMPNLSPATSANQRRSQRILLAVPLHVSGKHENRAAFVENTSTLIVNAHGGLISLKEAVVAGQILLLRNLKTGEEVSCTVIEVSPAPNGVHEVGMEFPQPDPRFWRVSFPPADWTPRSLEAKRLVHTGVAPAASKPPTVKK